MGYRILNISPEFRASFTERDGLEGPFFYVTGEVLYYDPKEGRYWDPTTDFYKTNEEMNFLHQEMVRILGNLTINP